MDEYDIINLTPDAGQMWGNMLKKLRESGQHALFAACSGADVEFLGEDIIVRVDDGARLILEKNKQTLCAILGDGVLKITTNKKPLNPKVEKLKELFGDALVVL